MNGKRAKIMMENTKVLQNNKSDGSSSEMETETKGEAAMNDKGDAAEAKYKSIYIETSEPSNISASLVNTTYEDIEVAESKAKKLYIDLTIMLSKSDKFKSKHKAVKDK